MSRIPAEENDHSVQGEFRGYTAGIVTFMHGKNYGCDLQRYAMQRVLAKLGLRALLINYVPHEVGRPCSRFLERLRFFLRPQTLVKIPFSFLDKRKAYFRRFERDFLEATPRLKTLEQLESAAAGFDCAVAGSDQIWNPTLCRTDAAAHFFMLGFMPSEKRISYAPSLGVSEVEPSFAGVLKRHLADFTWISVREEEGAAVLRKLLDVPIDVVLDPTMLLTAEEWDILCEPARSYPFQNEPYILCYALGNLDTVISTARQIKKRLSAKIVIFCFSPLDGIRLKWKCPESIPVLNAGPAEFVGLIRSAACVVTDSYHGSIFSILYHRPFWTMMRDRSAGISSMNSRMKTLFETFSLGERLFDAKGPALPPETPINGGLIEEILSRRRAESMEKLKSGLRKALFHDDATA